MRTYHLEQPENSTEGIVAFRCGRRTDRDDATWTGAAKPTRLCDACHAAATFAADVPAF